MKGVAGVVIGFVHDFAAGCWAASLAAVWYLDRHDLTGRAAEILTALEQRFFIAGVAFVVLVFATGAGRTFTYVPNVYGENDEAKRRKSLIVKHLVLLAIFGGGLWWQYRMAFG